MANVLLGATGSVAAVRVPALFDALTADGHAVKVVATDAAAYFFDRALVNGEVFRDADEWPGERYERGDEVLHIDL
ncbi:MAG TPA: flavoprotein, partial [Gemmataceae bacterium]|nr:flavoprotein [Gemmataceae bacterium]